MRRKPGGHLSQDGIALARLVGADYGQFDLVVTSMVPRAIETAIAMGHEVHEQIEELGHIPETVMAAIGWPRPFSEIAQGLTQSTTARAFAADLADLWSSIAKRVPEHGRGLVITHGLFIELGLLACLPDASPADWGGPIGYCEGVRLTYDGICQGAEMLRLPERYRLIEN